MSVPEPTNNEGIDPRLDVRFSGPVEVYIHVDEGASGVVTLDLDSPDFQNTHKTYLRAFYPRYVSEDEYVHSLQLCAYLPNGGAKGLNLRIITSRSWQYVPKVYVFHRAYSDTDVTIDIPASVESTLAGCYGENRPKPRKFSTRSRIRVRSSPDQRYADIMSLEALYGEGKFKHTKIGGSEDHGFVVGRYLYPDA